MRRAKPAREHWTRSKVYVSCLRAVAWVGGFASDHSQTTVKSTLHHTVSQAAVESTSLFAGSLYGELESRAHEIVERSQKAKG
jgi:hypothetical protein